MGVQGVWASTNNSDMVSTEYLHGESTEFSYRHPYHMERMEHLVRARSALGGRARSAKDGRARSTLHGEHGVPQITAGPRERRQAKVQHVKNNEGERNQRREEEQTTFGGCLYIVRTEFIGRVRTAFFCYKVTEYFCYKGTLAPREHKTSGCMHHKGKQQVQLDELEHRIECKGVGVG